MDYAIELQRIIDALAEEKTTQPKWRNKIKARLEELQPWCLMLYETPSFSDPMPATPNQNPYDHVSPGPASQADITNIPPSLREFANPDQLQPPGPQQPTI